MQNDPLVAVGLEVLLFLQSPPDGALIEFTVLSGTDMENTVPICGACFRNAVDTQRQYGRSFSSDVDFVEKAMRGALPVAVKRVLWTTDEVCGYCAVIKQGRMPRNWR